MTFSLRWSGIPFPAALVWPAWRIPDDSRGVVIRVQEDSLVIDLHIEVTYGTNISAIVKSITHKVCYTVEDITGIHVAAVNVFVDGLKNS